MAPGPTEGAFVAVGDGGMRPPTGIPAKRRAQAAQLDGPGGAAGSRPAKKDKIGEDLPEELSREEIARLLDEADEVHVEVINEATLKRMALQLERKVKVNQEMRIKHADDPEKFLKSEADLDEEVKRFAQVGPHPELYSELIKLGTLPVLIGLLNHANTDIAVDVFEVLSELTDPDTFQEVPEPEEFINALFDASLCQMTVDVLVRIKESASDEDARAVTNCLNMVENLADIMPVETCNQFAAIPKLLPWLIQRVRAPGEVDYNRVYATEILGIILQNSESSRTAMVKLEGVDKLLRGIGPYRKRDPADNEESEFVQNMFDCLCSLMLLPEHQVTFGKVQGLELMIRMMREKLFASNLALRLADHSLRHCPENCQLFVEKLGLPPLFALFMKRGPKPKTPAVAKEIEEHVTSIIQSLCRYCTGTPVARVLNKFTENQFEKLERLLELHEEYSRSVKEADSARLKGQVQSIDRELEVDEEEQLFLDRCDAGLFTLQQVDLVLIRLANMGNRQATQEIGKLLDAKGVPLKEVRDTVEEYVSHLGDAAKAEKKEVIEYLKATLKRYGGDTEGMDAPKDAPAAQQEGGGEETEDEPEGGSPVENPED